MNRSCEDRVAIRMMDLHPNCLELAVNIFGYVIPVLALFVTTVNILVVIVFMKPHVRSHTTMILTLIACADIIDIACPAVVFAYHYTFGYYKEFLTCKQTEWTYIFGGICVDMFNMLSLWLTVLLAFIRYRCLKFPFMARRVHSSKRIVLYVIGICMLVCLVHVPSFFIFDFQSVELIDPSTNLTNVVCGILETEGIFLKSCSRRKVLVIMETLLDSVVPCVLLVYYNCMMLLTLRQAEQSRSSLRRNDSCLKNGSFEMKTEHVDSTETLHDDLTNMSSNKEANSKNKTNECKPCREERFASTGCFSLSKRKTSNEDIHSCENLPHNLKKHNFRTKKSETSSLSDPTLDRLDKECRRTSWVILAVSTIVVVHEIPLVIVNIYTVSNYAYKPLPLAINGCFFVIQTMWQFITYPIIFLIYVCMSKAFRLELCKTLCLSFACKKQHRLANPRQSFVSPCSVRKLRRRDEEKPANPSQDKNLENDLEYV